MYQPQAVCFLVDEYTKFLFEMKHSKNGVLPLRDMGFRSVNDFVLKRIWVLPKQVPVHFCNDFGIVF